MKMNILIIIIIIHIIIIIMEMKMMNMDMIIMMNIMIMVMVLVAIMMVMMMINGQENNNNWIEHNTNVQWNQSHQYWWILISFPFTSFKHTNTNDIIKWKMKIDIHSYDAEKRHIFWIEMKKKIQFNLSKNLCIFLCD